MDHVTLLSPRLSKDTKTCRHPKTIAGSQRIYLKLKVSQIGKVFVTKSNQTASNVTFPHERLL